MCLSMFLDICEMNLIHYWEFNRSQDKYYVSIFIYMYVVCIFFIILFYFI